MDDYNLEKEHVLKNDGEVYTLRPYACIWNDDAYYVIGYSEKHQKIITPRLDCMQNVQMLQENAAHKLEELDLSEMIRLWNV